MSETSYRLTRCVVCGGADTDVVANAEQVRAEVEALWAFHGRRLRADTPAGRLVDRVAFSQDPPWRIVQCRDCGLVYRNPIERDVELREVYAAAPPPCDALEALHAVQRDSYRAQARRVARILAESGAGIRGLEVGSYVGAFLAAAREAGLTFEGLDVNAEVNAFTRSLGYRVTDGDLETALATSDGRPFDVVGVWNTFDQLPDPRAAAHAAWRLLAPDGLFAVRIPNGAFYTRLRARAVDGAGLGAAVARELLAQNNLLTFPYRFGFTVPSLRRLLEDIGFRIERVVGDVLVPIADEYTRPWARVEEQFVKGALRLLARRAPEQAPWIEIYARK